MSVVLVVMMVWVCVGGKGVARRRSRFCLWKKRRGKGKAASAEINALVRHVRPFGVTVQRPGKQ